MRCWGSAWGGWYLRPIGQLIDELRYLEPHWEARIDRMEFTPGLTGYWGDFAIWRQDFPASFVQVHLKSLEALREADQGVS